jgi:hypothetical protein
LLRGDRPDAPPDGLAVALARLRRHHDSNAYGTDKGPAFCIDGGSLEDLSVAAHEVARACAADGRYKVAHEAGVLGDLARAYAADLRL